MAAPTILVVDDETEICSLLETFLGGQGCRVVVANDSYAAMPKFREAKPQLMILDFQMPAGTGADLLRSIRNLESGASVPAIFLSAVPAQQIEMTVPSGRDVRYLAKPIDFKLLLATMEELIGPWKEEPMPAEPKPPADPDDPDNPPHSGTVLDLDAEP